MKGKTIVLNYEIQLARPYDSRWTVQGRLGLSNEQRDAVYIEGGSAKYHEWEPFSPYHAEFDHASWKSMEAEANAEVITVQTNSNPRFFSRPSA